MWQLLVNLALRVCGFHVCEEFTPWTRREQWIEKRVYWADVLVQIHPPALVPIQERRCTVCGKIQQQRLSH